eukprot:8033193-Alexandrium_andersonii.AAC.1
MGGASPLADGAQPPGLGEEDLVGLRMKALAGLGLRAREAGTASSSMPSPSGLAIPIWASA